MFPCLASLVVQRSGCRPIVAGAGRSPSIGSDETVWTKATRPPTKIILRLLVRRLLRLIRRPPALSPSGAVEPCGSAEREPKPPSDYQVLLVTPPRSTEARMPSGSAAT